MRKEAKHAARAADRHSLKLHIHKTERDTDRRCARNWVGHPRQSRQHTLQQACDQESDEKANRDDHQIKHHAGDIERRHIQPITKADRHTMRSDNELRIQADANKVGGENTRQKGENDAHKFRHNRLPALR